MVIRILTDLGRLNMTRRKIFGAFGAWSALAIIGDFSVEHLTSYKVVIFNTSRNTKSQKSFESADEFWSQHSDSFAEKLNEEFRSSGKLREVKTFLSRDQKSAVLVKYYRSRRDHEEYVSRLADHHQKFSLREKGISQTIC